MRDEIRRALKPEDDITNLASALAQINQFLDDHARMKEKAYSLLRTLRNLDIPNDEYREAVDRTQKIIREMYGDPDDQ